MDPFDLSGRHALVTGAGGHLGSAFAGALASRGAHVWLAGRDGGSLDSVADHITREGGSASVMILDVLDQSAIATAERRIAQTAPRLDILVSNAHRPRSGGLGDVTARHFSEAAMQSSGALHELVRAFRPLLRRGPEEAPSSVIAVASMYATVSPDPRVYATESEQNPADYGAAKAGLVQFARHLAVHLATDGIRVNTISPGPFPRLEGADAQFLSRLAERVPLGRVGRAAELTTALLFLASPASSYVTGIDVPVDGGWTAW